MGDSTGSHVGAPGQTTPGNRDDEAEQGNPQYIAFVLVPVFFLLGLLGVLVCHFLKRRGYRCTTQAEEEEEEEERKRRDLEQGGELNDTLSESNNDTVGQIVRYIMKNEANTDALKAMVHDNSIDSDGPVTPTSPSPPVTPVSPAVPGVPAPPPAPPPRHTCSHLHTIGGAGGPGNACQRCAQRRGWPLVRRTSNRRTDRRSQGEVTVLAVGRFRVTKCEKPAKERRTLLVADGNGSAPTSPTGAGPESGAFVASQQEQPDDAK